MAFIGKGQNIAQVTTVLICGRTDLLSENCIDVVSNSYNTIIAGKTSFGRKKKRVHVYETLTDDEKFRWIFEAYSVDVVWYISGYTDIGEGLYDEVKNIGSVMDKCREFGVNKVIVLSSLEALNFHPLFGISNEVIKKIFASDRAYNIAHFEEAVRFYSESKSVKTIILRAPYVVDDVNYDNFLGKIFRQMDEERRVVLPYREENQLDFITTMDLVELMMLISEEYTDESATYNVSSGYLETFKSFEEELKVLNPEIEVRYEALLNYTGVQHYSINLKKQYGFLPSDNVFASLPEYYQNYKKASGRLKKQRRGKLFGGKVLPLLVRYFEVIFFALVMQLLLYLTKDSVYFRYVDIRLFYVLVMGTVHGMQAGIAAGGLACVSLLLSFNSLGITGTMIFYNIENWLPFVILLMTGSITGYVRSVHNQKVTSVERENELVREKYVFLNQVYNGLIDNKSRYKRQILGYQDSFGKIFEAVQKLDSALPSDIFMHGIGILEETLENDSVAVYTLDQNGRYGRLMACSGKYMPVLKKSINLEEHAELLEVTGSGKMWKNSEFVRGEPEFAFGIRDKDSLRIIIALYEVRADQKGLYYENLFRILCDLIRLSFLRALKYQEAIDDEKYYPGTGVLYPVYYEEALKVQKEMKNNGISNYTEIRFDSSDPELVYRFMKGKNRQTDILGCGSDGKIHLILTQTGEDSFGFFEKRMAGSMIGYEKVEQ